METYYLSWTEYLPHLKTTITDLLFNEELTDITLYVEGKTIRAHKLILSACSAYFRELFKEISQQNNPIVVIKGVSYWALKEILEFIYKGEVKVKTNKFNCFMEAAKFLQVSGLTLSEDNDNTNNDSYEKNNIETFSKDVETNSNCSKNIEANKKEIKNIEASSRNTRNITRNSKDAKVVYIDKELDNFDRRWNDHDYEYYDTEENTKLIQEKMEIENVKPNEDISIEEIFLDTNNCDYSQNNHHKIVGEEIVNRIQGAAEEYRTLDGLYKCVFCHKNYAKKTVLLNHLNVHSGKTCPVCNMLFPRKTALEKHVAQVHNPITPKRAKLSIRK